MRSFFNTLNHRLAAISGRKAGLIVLALAFLFGLAYNELNLWASEAARPGRGQLNGATVLSIDNEYYLTPAENLLERGEWCRTPCLGEGTYVRRTPGYSVWYLLFRAPFGPVGGLYVLRTFQLLLFAFSAWALFSTLGVWGVTPWARWLVGGLYALLPIYGGYSYFTLTEPLSIPLCVLYGWALFHAAFAPRTSARKLRLYALAAALGVAALLTRPFAGVLLLAFPAMLVWDLRRGLALGQFIRIALVSAIVPAVMWGSWVVRNYAVTGGDIVLLERYSDPTTYDIYKPGHNALWDLVASWGGGLNDMAHLRNMLSEAQHGRGDTALALAAIEKAVPAGVLERLGPERFARIVLSMQQTYKEAYAPYFATMNTPLPAEYPARELALADSVRQLRAQFISQNSGLWLLSFGKLFGQMALHSGTSHLYFFQEPFRSRFAPLKAVLGLLFVLHAGLYGLFVVGFLLAWRRLGLLPWVALFGPPALLILALMFIGIVEQRYTFVVEPLMLVALAAWLVGRRPLNSQVA